jgi:hypothetical protein
MKSIKQKKSRLAYTKNTITELDETKNNFLASQSFSWSALVVASIAITKKMHITIHNI